MKETSTTHKETTMALIEWNGTLEVGIATIDGQHRQLVKVTNDLNDAMKSGKAKETLGSIIASLAQYTTTHFATEEGLFDKFAYPERAAHKKQHAEFVAKVSGFQKDFGAGKVALSIEVVNFLAQWLRNHICGDDRKYVPFLQKNGVK
jgi:hemerythrin-like metal-binding protein